MVPVESGQKAYLFFRKGFIVDLDPDEISLQVVRVAKAFPGVETRHMITVDGVVSQD